MNYSKTILGGRLTRDLELRNAPSGTQMVTGCIAVNGGKRKGEQDEDVLFMEFVAYGDRGASLAKHHRKGSTVLLEGRLKTDRWVDRETQRKAERTKLVVDSWSFCGAPPGAQESASGPATESQESGRPIPADEVPF